LLGNRIIALRRKSLLFSDADRFENSAGRGGVVERDVHRLRRERVRDGAVELWLADSRRPSVTPPAENDPGLACLIRGAERGGALLAPEGTGTVDAEIQTDGSALSAEVSRLRLQAELAQVSSTC